MSDTTPNNTKEKTQQDEARPDHPKWLNVFTLFSWWLGADGRVFVIRQRWFDHTYTHLVLLELLQKDSEVAIVISYEDFFANYAGGKLTRTSASATKTQPTLSVANLIPDWGN